MHHRRRTRIRRLLAIGTALVLVVGLSSTASSADPTEPDPTVRGPGKVLPPDTSVYFGAGFAGANTSARVGRVKITVDVAPFPIAAYVQPYYRSRGRFGSGGIPFFKRATGALLPERPDPGCDYYVGALFADIYAVDVAQSINKADPTTSGPGVYRSVGQLPDTPIALLAFGSIPVTAVLHLRQISNTRGVLEPFFFDPANARSSVVRGVPLTGSTPTKCDAAWETAAAPATITGRVTLSISDVRVDGRAIPVGSRCRTVSPLALNLTGETVTYGGGLDGDAANGGYLYQTRNRSTANAANPVALYPDSSNLTIPAFTGCRTPSGDDYSRLVTGLASGSNNSLALRFSAIAFGGTDREHPNTCDPFGFAPCAVGVDDPIRPPQPGR